MSDLPKVSPMGELVVRRDAAENALVEYLITQVGYTVTPLETALHKIIEYRQGVFSVAYRAGLIAGLEAAAQSVPQSSADVREYIRALIKDRE